MTAIEALKEHIEKTKQDKYAGGVETIDFIQSKKLGFEMGNVVKYAVRIEKLGKPEDCLKAAHYLLMQYDKLITQKGVFVTGLRQADIPEFIGPGNIILNAGGGDSGVCGSIPGVRTPAFCLVNECNNTAVPSVETCSKCEHRRPR